MLTHIHTSLLKFEMICVSYPGCFEGFVKHYGQRNGRENVKDNCPDDDGAVSPVEAEDVAVAKDGKEERQDRQGADEVEGIVGPGQLWGEGDPFWRILFSCEDEVGEGGRENSLRMIDKKEDEALARQPLQGEQGEDDVRK